jgi:NDP-sugar pyrophosphorylase family protein
MLPALVLTAGLGTRLGALTRDRAKPSLPVAGQSIAERVLRWLHREGVRDAVLNLHYQPHTVTGAVGDGRHLGVRVRYSLEPVLLGSAGGPRHALPLLDLCADPAVPGTFLIVNGDTLTDISLAPVVSAHIASGADVTMVVIANPAPQQYNGIVADAEGVVTGVIPRGHAEPTWHYVGIQVVNRRVFAELPDDTPAESVSGIYREMIAASPGRVRVFPVDAAFFDIGTPADYEATCAAFERRR